MHRLQNRWYNFLAEMLSLDGASFQLFQPVMPIAPTDAALWDVLDVVPPASLTFNPAMRDAVRFSDVYATIARQMRTPTESLADAIGASDAEAWSAYLATLSPQPAPSQRAALFQNWAARRAVASTSAGVAFLSRSVLAPSPRLLDPGGGTASFVGGYADLLQLVCASRGCRGSFDSRLASADVHGTWAREGDADVDGLWPGGDRAPARKFTAARTTAHVAVERCATWTVTPGDWYSSSLLNAAYSDAASPPWPVDARPSWNDLFGPGGRLLRALAAVVVIDGVTITLTSDASFDAAEQRTILAHASNGLWPLYASASDAVCMEVTFRRRGAMVIEMSSEPDHPIVLGGNVLDIARYLGHASDDRAAASR